MRRILLAVQDFISERFNLHSDKEDEAFIIESTGKFAKPLSKKDKPILQKWIKQRLHADQLKLILE